MWPDPKPPLCFTFINPLQGLCKKKAKGGGGWRSGVPLGAEIASWTGTPPNSDPHRAGVNPRISLGGGGVEVLRLQEKENMRGAEPAGASRYLPNTDNMRRENPRLNNAPNPASTNTRTSMDVACLHPPNGLRHPRP